jgi:solute carrier family 34 (sodium-dependent phosphate cotransporter)
VEQVHLESWHPSRPESPWALRLRAVFVLLLLFIFLVGIRGLGNGFEGLGKDVLDHVFRATANPLVGLVVGILGTTLVQSSSVSTSMIVALVAAPASPLPVSDAIPMIMGANIGTTVTNTIVSLGHVGRADEFRRAFSAATCHDFFNFIAVAFLLPLELATGVLERLSGALAETLAGGGGTSLPNPIKSATGALVLPTERLLRSLFDSPRAAAIFLIVLSGILIFGTLFLIVKTMRRLTASRMESTLTRALGMSPHLGLLVGAVLTVMVQSSSITTSVMVPLAGAGIVTVRQVFPMSLGANIGTTVTALLASMAAPSETAQFAVQIALVHLFFNVIGVLLIYPVPRVRMIPVRLAEWLAGIAVKSRRYAIFYVLGLFYAVPLLLILISELM